MTATSTAEAMATLAVAQSAMPKGALATASQSSLRQAAEPTMTLSSYAMKAGASIAELQALLEMQVRADNHQLEMLRERRRMEREDAEIAAAIAFSEAFALFRGENVVIPKTKQVQQTTRDGRVGPSFWQAEFDQVCQLLSPALSKYGFSFRHDMRFGAREWKSDGSNPAIPAGTSIDIPWVYVTCFLSHKSGHTIRLDLEGPPWETGSMNDLQRMQASASYLKRQSLLAITGTPTGGEDDESHRNPAAQKGSPSADPAASKATENERQMLVSAGQQWATQGLKPLTSWWGSLTTQQRNGLMVEFAGWRKAAQQFDADKGGR